MASRSFRGDLSRREWLGSAAAAFVAAGIGRHGRALGAEPASDRNDLIAGIEQSVIFSGRDGGPSWFHPRACLLKGDRPEVLMTLQLISGSDVFGPVHWTTSDRLGTTWSAPKPIPRLGRESLGDGWERGVCDVVPEFHAETGTVLAMGHDVYYENGVLARPQRERRPVYVVRSSDGTWSEPRHLEWDDPRTTAIFTCGCSQRINLSGGDLLVPLSFGPKDRTHRSVTTVLCRFDGEQVSIKKVGRELVNTAGRGLLEPSLASFDDRYWMTIRAEDGRGHVAVSNDGLDWSDPQPWCWDDGTPLEMSTTQQHWLTHSAGLFLVYNRKADGNEKVIRWRAPLYMAAVNTKTLRLNRESERVVLPIVGDADNAPRNVALMGNFHTLDVTPDESWVTVGENRPYDQYRGDTLLARIKWTQANERLAPG